MFRKLGWGSGLLCVSAMTTSAYAIISPGMVDDFSDGTVMGWIEGAPSPNQPTIVADGGPGGLGDAFLENISTGEFGPGGKLAMFNDERWTGSYLDAGVTSIEADMRNLGDTPLTMRFRLLNGGNDVFTEGVELSPGGDWERVSFSLAAEDLLDNTAPLDVLANVTQVWLFHNPSVSHPGPDSAAMLGLDNITAVALPQVLPGDFNDNGMVEQGDLDLVLLNWGGPADPVPDGWLSDLPSGNVDQDELDRVLLNWGVGTNGVILAVRNVPEPSSLLLLSVGIGLYLCGLAGRCR